MAKVTKHRGIFEPFIKPLRGRHNSVRYRFFVLPREELTLFWFRVTGRSWLEFYAQRLDGMVDVDRPVPERYFEHGRQQAQWLKDQGLQPHHRFLDYGCGILRLAHSLLPYLDKGNYVGVDISAERLKKGRALVSSIGIAPDAYRLEVVKDCKLRELKGEKFDYVWALSVFTHMPIEDIKEMLLSLKPLLNDGAQFFCSFAQAPEYSRKQTKDFYYPEAVFRQTCEKAGYRMDIMPDWPQGNVMARLRLA